MARGFADNLACLASDGMPAVTRHAFHPRDDGGPRALKHAKSSLDACGNHTCEQDRGHFRSLLGRGFSPDIFNFLRDYRGNCRARIVQDAETAGLFDAALSALASDSLAQQIDALGVLDLAHGARFRLAVRRQVMSGGSPAVRCLALRTFVLMGAKPADAALAAWIDGTGPRLTTAHGPLFDVIARQAGFRMVDVLEMIENPIFRTHLQRALFRHERVAAPVQSLRSANQKPGLSALLGMAA